MNERPLLVEPAPVLAELTTYSTGRPVDGIDLVLDFNERLTPPDALADASRARRVAHQPLPGAGRARAPHRRASRRPGSLGPGHRRRRRRPRTHRALGLRPRPHGDHDDAQLRHDPPLHPDRGRRVGRDPVVARRFSARGRPRAGGRHHRAGLCRQPQQPHRCGRLARCLPPSARGPAPHPRPPRPGLRGLHRPRIRPHVGGSRISQRRHRPHPLQGLGRGRSPGRLRPRRSAGGGLAAPDRPALSGVGAVARHGGDHARRRRRPRIAAASPRSAGNGTTSPDS